MLMINSFQTSTFFGLKSCSVILLRASGQQMAQLDLTLMKSQGHCSRLSSHYSSRRSVLPQMLHSLHCAAAQNLCFVMMRRQMFRGNPPFTHYVINNCNLHMNFQCSPYLKHRIVLTHMLIKVLLGSHLYSLKE